MSEATWLGSNGIMSWMSNSAVSTPMHTYLSQERRSNVHRQVPLTTTTRLCHASAAIRKYDVIYHQREAGEIYDTRWYPFAAAVHGAPRGGWVHSLHNSGFKRFYARQHSWLFLKCCNSTLPCCSYRG
jgi:hypothetical protein